MEFRYYFQRIIFTLRFLLTRICSAYYQMTRVWYIIWEFDRIRSRHIFCFTQIFEPWKKLPDVIAFDLNDLIKMNIFLRNIVAQQIKKKEEVFGDWFTVNCMPSMQTRNAPTRVKYALIFTQCLRKSPKSAQPNEINRKRHIFSAATFWKFSRRFGTYGRTKRASGDITQRWFENRFIWHLWGCLSYTKLFALIPFETAPSSSGVYFLHFCWGYLRRYLSWLPSLRVQSIM